MSHDWAVCPQCGGDTHIFNSRPQRKRRECKSCGHRYSTPETGDLRRTTFACPECKGWAAAIATRQQADGIKRRRRCSQCNFTFYTLQTSEGGPEVQIEVETRVRGVRKPRKKLPPKPRAQTKPHTQAKRASQPAPRPPRPKTTEEKGYVPSTRVLIEHMLDDRQEDWRGDE